MRSCQRLSRPFVGIVTIVFLTGCAASQPRVAPAPPVPAARAATAVAPAAATTADLQQLVNDAYARFKDVRDGTNADYIPELAKVPSDLFGVAIVTARGDTYSAGDVDHAFSIQSVSKPFTAALVMEQQGSDAIAQKIGVEPTGLKFNSILATQIIPQVSVNPLVNSGAIASVSMVQAKSAKERFNTILDYFDRLSGAKLKVIEDVYKSEAATNQRNRAHAYILAAEERIYSDPMEAVDVYTRQCSIGVTAKQLGVMGATLANNGVNPITQQRVLEAKYVPKVLAIMMMAGFYNESGMWAYSAGLPAKTGVGGGIVAVVPGKMAIVGFSPRLNPAGNSVRATKAIQYITDQLGVNLFGSGR